MKNLAMERKLKKRELIDVSRCPTTPEGHYILESPEVDTFFVSDMDYADCTLERWVWSIGRRRTDGVILASTEHPPIFQDNPDFELIWLR